MAQGWEAMSPAIEFIARINQLEGQLKKAERERATAVAWWLPYRDSLRVKAKRDLASSVEHANEGWNGRLDAERERDEAKATILRIGLLVEEGVVNPKPPNVPWVRVSKLKNALKKRKDWRSK